MRFIRIQNDVNITEHSHALHVSFILEARGRSRAESPKRTHREVIVTFDGHPAIAVAKLNNKHKT